MLTDRFIFTLRDFVSDFVKETKTPLDMEYKTYEKQLNNTFDESTRAITTDINKDIEWFSQEENRHLIQGFKKQGKIIHQHAIELSRHISDIKTKIKDAMIDSGRRKLGSIIGDSVKTGINSSFSPGVKVGHNSTIGSGVLLYDDVPSDTRVLVKQNHIIQDKNKKKE